MSRVRAAVLSGIGATALVLSMLAGGGAAQAGAGSGLADCNLAKVGYVKKNSNFAGSGYYQAGHSYATPEIPFTFGKGLTQNFVGQKAVWFVENGEGNGWVVAPYIVCL